MQDDHLELELYLIYEAKRFRMEVPKEISGHVLLATLQEAFISCGKAKYLYLLDSQSILDLSKKLEQQNIHDGDVLCLI